MLLNDEETQMVTYTAYSYQCAIDRLKYMKKTIVDALRDASGDEFLKLHGTFYGEFGVIDMLDRIIADGMMYLETPTISQLVDTMKAEVAPPFTVENRVMDPVSFYHNLKLVGVARNREAYLATLKQIGDKKLKGCQALIGEELINITENGELEHEPKNGSVIPEDTMDYLHWKRGV